jgi:hypothetical protein
MIVKGVGVIKSDIHKGLPRIRYVDPDELPSGFIDEVKKGGQNIPYNPGFEAEPDLSPMSTPNLFEAPKPLPPQKEGKKAKNTAQKKEKTDSVIMYAGDNDYARENEIWKVGGSGPAFTMTEPKITGALVMDSEGKTEVVPFTPEPGKEYYDIQTKIKAWIGVDPGKNGGIITITEHGKMKKAVIPLIGDDLDSRKLFEIISDLKTEFDVTLIMESVHSIFGTSASSNFTFGYICGALEGIIMASRIKFIKVQPKAWQKEMWLSTEVEYQPLKPNQKRPSIDTKLTSLKAALRLFPHFDFRKSERAKNPHDGLVDAALMAEYGRRKNL